MSDVLVSVKNLVKEFPIRGGFFQRVVANVHAVNNVSFEIRRGETFGLVGESGCGKSTLGRCLLRLLEPTSGSVQYQGQDLLAMNPKQMREMRRKMQIVFQDPYAALNPRMRVEAILSEPLEVHGIGDGTRDRRKRVERLLELVGLRADAMTRFPHEFSGGQRQRICIARALAVEPEFLVCDEPVSALDVSIQAQVVNLLEDLQKELGLTYLFVAHDLKVVQHISTRIAVMYLGQIVESAEAMELYRSPKHPYTQALLSAIPIADPHTKRQRVVLKGDVPSPVRLPRGCSFHTRCGHAIDSCRRERPGLSQVSDGHVSACPVLLTK